MWWILTSLIAIIVVALILYIKSEQNFFKKHGVPTPKIVFLIGNISRTLLGKQNIGLVISDAYKEMTGYRYFGFYKFVSRCVIIRDPELISKILIKDFAHFANNDINVDENVDFIMSKNLFVLNDHKWKAMRQLLTPMFSNGKMTLNKKKANTLLIVFRVLLKLKNMFPLVQEVSQRLVNYVHKEIDAGRNICVNGDLLCIKFTVDNVGNCAFGIDSKAFEGDTKFAELATNFSDTSFFTAAKFFITFILPSLQKPLKLKFFKDEVETYLMQVVSENLRYRKENNIVRNDFLDQIYALKNKSTEYAFSDRDVVAQSAGFFVDGFETTAGLLSFILYDIACHPNVQNKLREEIKQSKEKNKNTISYESVFELNYLDCIVNESLRMNGAVMILFKVCTKPYYLPEIKEGSNVRLMLHPGDSLILPIDGLHSDPAHFPDPATFDPDRFNEDNKSMILKHTFAPFGMGPRLCIGQRFALMQVKLAIIALISNFEISVNPKMWPFEIHPTTVVRIPKRGFWFDFKKV